MSATAIQVQAGKVFDPLHEVATACEGQPHVVILGAGASRAACGKKLPLMNDLVDVCGLASILAGCRIDYAQKDFESLYSDLARECQFDKCRAQLEKRIHDYFSSLRLPENPTVYDYLVMSLRPKDVIATFNWDPLLVQAARRNGGHVELPQLLFLHGNVAVGWCERDMRKGPYPGRCPVCNNAFKQTQLLYPVKAKNYSGQPFIRDEWLDLQDALNKACIVTIFGFGAPETDVEAVDLMAKAWPHRATQRAEWVEIINTEDLDTLKKRWDRFILSNHCDVVADFYDSRIARHPRRTGEAWAATHLFGMWEGDNPVPKDVELSALQEWFAQFKEAEKDCAMEIK